MTPLQFIDWLDGALDFDELAQTIHGTHQIHPELREMLRRRLNAVDRQPVAEAEVDPHPYRVTRDVPQASDGGDTLTNETLEEIRDALRLRTAGGSVPFLGGGHAHAINPLGIHSHGVHSHGLTGFVDPSMLTTTVNASPAVKSSANAV
ncbi:hypothetical protein FQZ97_821540 [compost metagenome]